MPERNATTVLETVPRNAYCPICGTRLHDAAKTLERFGEGFCSEAHADEFTLTVRTARVRAALVRIDGACERGSGTSVPSGWPARLGRVLCWGGPGLALVATALILSGSGGLILGAASAVLPVLAVLACPAGMYLMMRAMSTPGRPGGRDSESQNPR